MNDEELIKRRPLKLTPERARKLRADRITTGGLLSADEQYWWETAERAPFGGIVIGREGNPYLVRVYLTPERVDEGGPSKAMYLHYFVRGDADLNPHNHPHDRSESLILTGGYTEFSYRPDTGQRQYGVMPPNLVTVFKPGDWNRGLAAETFHRVELHEPDKGCWTLFIAGRRRQPSDGTDWGFWDLQQHEFVPWGAYPLQH